MPALSKILIYARDANKTADFYEKFFGFKQHSDDDGRIIELVSIDGGANILVHQAAR
ncbi:MAG: VOC family protein [Candidatus Melainabacteria bacterium]|nr:VOC family protein [Candidatus Melainabacteria bacterium]